MFAGKIYECKESCVNARPTHKEIRLGVSSILLLKSDNTRISCTNVNTTAALANLASHIQSPVNSYKPVLTQHNKTKETYS